MAFQSKLVRPVAAVCFVLLAKVAPVVAGTVARDGSVGPSGPISKAGANFAIPASSGRQVGGNLFHSFSTFDLDAGESATFSGPGSVRNVLARITGGAPSSIDGTIRCDIANANLFLMNPAGVLFGPNAAIDVNGSFAVTTADVLKLSDGGKFAANVTPASNVLTSAPPAAFGFLSASPAPVVVQGASGQFASLAVSAGKTLSVVAGDIRIENAILQSPTGRVNLIAVGSANDVGFDATSSTSTPALSQPAAGRILLSNAAINPISPAPDFTPGGSIAVRAKDMLLDGALIQSLPVAPGTADIDVDLAGSLGIFNGGAIRAGGDGDVPGGNIRVRARSIELQNGIDGAGLAGILTVASGRAQGGDLDVRADEVSVTAGSLLGSITIGPGDSGGSLIAANRLHVDGLGAPPGIQSALRTGATDNGTGGAGDLRIVADVLTVDHGAIISSRTSGGRAGGAIRIQAGSVDVLNDSRIATATTDSGDGGAIDVRVSGRLRIATGGQIFSQTTGTGIGGGISISAGQFELDNAGGGDTQVFTQAVEPEGLAATATAGSAGAIDISADTIAIRNQAVIQSRAFGTRAGGSISLAATQSILLDAGRFDGSDIVPAMISADTFGPLVGGDIMLVAPRVDLANAAQISASTAGAGRGGTVSIRASEHFTLTSGSGVLSVSGGNLGGAAGGVEIDAAAVTIDRAGSPRPTGISAQALGEGAGGGVRISASDVSVLNGARITADTADAGNAGDITINASRSVTLTGGGLATDQFNPGISASTLDKGRGGAISVRTPLLTVSSGAEIQASAAGVGNSQAIVIVADKVVLDGSGSANPTGISGDTVGRGSGARIEVSGRELQISNGAQIAAQTDGPGKGGEIATVFSDRISLDGAVITDNATVSSGLNAQATAGGDGGTITVQSPILSVMNNAAVSASTSGSGRGGDVSVTASNMVTLGQGGRIASQATATGGAGTITVGGGSVVIDGQAGGVPTGILAQTDGTGIGGTIDVNVKRLAVVRGGQISASSFGPGTAGNIRIAADRLLIDSLGYRPPAGGEIPAELLSTGVLARAVDPAGGPAGDIVIRANRFRVNDRGLVTASTQNQALEGGDIQLRVGTFELFNSDLTTEAKGRGGNIAINASDLIYLRQSKVNASAGGDGGRVTIDPPIVVLDRSTINALSGGKQVVVRIESSGFFSSNSQILTNSPIDLPETDISGALIPLRAEFASQITALVPACNIFGQENSLISRFQVVSRGGEPALPEGWSPAHDDGPNLPHP